MSVPDSMSGHHLSLKFLKRLPPAVIVSVYCVIHESIASVNPLAKEERLSSSRLPLSFNKL